MPLGTDTLRNVLLLRRKPQGAEQHAASDELLRAPRCPDTLTSLFIFLQALDVLLNIECVNGSSLIAVIGDERVGIVPLRRGRLNGWWAAAANDRRPLNVLEQESMCQGVR